MRCTRSFQYCWTQSNCDYCWQNALHQQYYNEMEPHLLVSRDRMDEGHWAVFKSNLFGVWSLNYQFPILNSTLLDVWFQGMTIAFDLRDNWVPGDMFTPRQPYWSTCSIFFIHFFTPHPIFVSDPRESEVTPLDSNNWKLRWSGIYCFHEVVWRLEMGTWTIKDLSL